MIEVIFDIETQKLFDQIPDPSKVEDLLVSVVSAYRRELDENMQEKGGEMKTFWIEDKGLGPLLAEMWPWFEEADRLIGFNSVKFDAPVLAPLYTAGNIMKLNHFDILEKVRQSLGHRLSLNAIAAETLGEKKIAVGLDAVDWWNAGDSESLEKLKKYCEMDVVVTKKVYDYGLAHGKLMFKDKWNEPREMEVDFSYPKVEEEEEQQMGLF